MRQNEKGGTRAVPPEIIAVRPFYAPPGECARILGFPTDNFNSMVLTLRRTPLERSPAFAHLEDWQVLDECGWPHLREARARQPRSGVVMVDHNIRRAALWPAHQRHGGKVRRPTTNLVSCNPVLIAWQGTDMQFDQLKRREFGTLLSAARRLCGRSQRRAQQPALPIIGFLSGSSLRSLSNQIAAFPSWPKGNWFRR
jgi:hypothetical protein